MILREAWRELLYRKKFVVLFILNFSLGLSGLVTMDSFRASIRANIEQGQKQILGADFAISSRKPLPPNIAIENIGQANSVELFTMVRAEKVAKLIGLKASSANLPLVGEIELANGERKKMSDLPKGQAWIYPELAQQLQLQVGEEFTLGEKSFQVNGIIRNDPAQGIRGISSSGKVFISLEDLVDTKLLRAESTATYSNFYLLPNGIDLKKFLAELEKKFPDPSLQFLTPAKAGQDSSRLLDYLSDFLGLSSLVALFLAALGSAYLFRSWLAQRTSIFAMHQVLGLTFYQALAIPFVQMLLLALAAAPFTLALAQIEISMLSQLVASIAPVNLAALLSWRAFFLSLLLGVCTAGLLALPFLRNLKNIPAKYLISGDMPEAQFNRLALYFIPAFLFLFFLSVREAHSIRNASIFFSALCLALFCFSLVALSLLNFLRKFSFSFLPWNLRHGLYFLSRKGISSASAFTALALGSLLLNLLPQIRASLATEIDRPQKLPSLFLFDIQPEQLDPLKEKMRGFGLELDNISPLVRARLLTVNALPFERQSENSNFRTREDEMESRFRNRGFNLSYSDTLNYSETLYAGKVFDSSSASQISVEKGFADRLHLKLGDVLKFDVQGAEIEGQIVNIRKVKWTSFRPNFFVVFNSGVLNEAPQTFLASLPAIAEAKKIEIQNSISTEYSNISSVDIKATIDKAMELVDKMRWSLYLMAGIALFSGVMVLFSIATQQSESRRWDLNLCRILGASQNNLRQMVLFEFGLLSFLASFFGGFLSIALAWALMFFIFDGALKVNFFALFASIAGATIISLLVATWASQSLWKRNADLELRSRL